MAEQQIVKGNTSARGFASMDPAKQREIASRGGRAAHAKGTAHEFTPEEAREAGRKGGQSRALRNQQSALRPSTQMNSMNSLNSIQPTQ
jgi:general stress protein YciG